MLTVYLAGAIRDDRPDDIEWREEAITKLQDVARCLNPLGGKTFNTDTKEWLLHGTKGDAKTIVKHDFWCVDNVDAVIFNFLSLAEGYASIGTLVEFGRATANGVLSYAIVAEHYTGHENRKMFSLHPFIAENSAKVFHDVESCLDFASAQFASMGGLAPRFGGLLEGGYVREDNRKS